MKLRAMTLMLAAAAACMGAAPRGTDARPDRGRQAEKKPQQARTLKDWAEREAAALLARDADSDEDAAALAAEAEAVLVRVAAQAEPARDADALIAAAEAAQLTGLLASADKGTRADLRSALRENKAAASDLAAVLNQGDDPQGVAEVFLKLSGQFGKSIDRVPALVAAMAVVHDTPVSVRCNENSKAAPPVEQLFAYFVGNAGRIAADFRSGPPEMLAFLVDAAPDVAELEWALERHGASPQVGHLYNLIQYDLEHYLQGQKKKLTQEGFSLQNIAKVGGICIDQAYYAAMVGKAIGVPAVIVRGAGLSGEGHAWLGYLRRQGGRMVWDTREGRYEESKFYSGTAYDPRRGAEVGEAEIGVQAALFSTPQKKVRLAKALSLGAMALSRVSAAPAPIETMTRAGGSREPGASSAEAMLRLAAAECPSLPEIWSAVETLAPTLSTEQIGWWIDKAGAVGGPLPRSEQPTPGQWPEFTFAVTERLLSHLRDDRVAAGAWERVFKMYEARPDLALRARVEMARRAADAGEKEAALRAYQEAAVRYANAGPIVMDALRGAEALLKPAGSAGAAAYASLAGDVWRRVSRPPATTMLFRQSVWARVGEMYASALVASGRGADAEAVRRQIESAAPAKRS